MTAITAAAAVIAVVVVRTAATPAWAAWFDTIGHGRAVDSRWVAYGYSSDVLGRDTSPFRMESYGRSVGNGLVSWVVSALLGITAGQL